MSHTTPSNANLARIPDRSALGWILVLLVAVLVYVLPDGGVMNAGFAFDDIHLIVTNDSLRQGESPLTGFTGDYYTTGAKSASGEVRALGYYRPIAVLSTWIDHAVWKENPLGYHLTNLLFHVLSSLLVFALARRLLPSQPWFATIAAVLFAAHPVHPESVAFVSGRVDVLATAFGLASIVAALRGRIALSAAAFALAIGSKEMAITIPVLVVLAARFAVTDPPSSWGRAIRAAVPHAIVAVVYLAIRVAVIGSPLSDAEGVGGSVVARIGTVLSSYLGLLVWPPFRFNVEPSLLPASGIALIGRWLVVIAAVVGAIWLSRKPGWRIVGFGLAWVLITLIPVSQLVPVETMLSERYLYLPSVGACLIFAAMIIRLPRTAALAVAALLTLGYGASTVVRVAPWESNLTFWEAKAALSPNSPEPHSALAHELALDGRIEEAATEYELALEKDPAHLEALNNYALLLMDQGRLDGAMGYATKILRINPTYPEGLNTIATVFFNMGRFGEAVGQYRRAVRANPDYRQAWINLGNTYLTASVPDSAITSYRRAIELGRDRDLEVQLARCYAMSGQPQKGIDYLHEIGTVKPGTAESFILQGNLDFMAGNRQAGLASVLRATQSNPDMVEPWIELGQMMDVMGNPAKAVEAFEKALSIDPNASVAHNNLGVAEENRGNLDAALQHYQEALRLSPDDPIVMRNVGGVLVEQGRHEEALPFLDEAVKRSRRDALAFLYRGRAHQGMQQLTPAMTDYQAAATINPAFADAHYRLGELQILNRQGEAGRASLQQFLQRSRPDDPRREGVEDFLNTDPPGDTP